LPTRPFQFARFIDSNGGACADRRDVLISFPSVNGECHCWLANCCALDLAMNYVPNTIPRCEHFDAAMRSAVRGKSLEPVTRKVTVQEQDRVRDQREHRASCIFCVRLAAGTCHSKPPPIKTWYSVVVRGERRSERRSKVQLQRCLMIDWPTRLRRRRCRTRNCGADPTCRLCRLSRCDN
jgi:hypothetical protein